MLCEPGTYGALWLSKTLPAYAGQVSVEFIPAKAGVALGQGDNGAGPGRTLRQPQSGHQGSRQVEPMSSAQGE